MNRQPRFLRAAAALLVTALLGQAAAQANNNLTVYSGRNEALIGPLIEQFRAANPGIRVQVRYGDSAQLAAQILEEGPRSPADVFFSQDAGALGALVEAGRLGTLPQTLLNRVNPAYRAPGGEWLATSGRARVLAYNTRTLQANQLPASVFDLTGPQWRGRVGWAPTNASFQSFVTAMRVTHGDARTEQWLRDMKANGVRDYRNNVAIVEAVGRGEVAVGLTNHYYLYNFLRDQGTGFPVRNGYFRAGDIGNMLNVAGVGVLSGARNQVAAQRFVAFLTSPQAQTYFANQTFEYPLAGGVRPNAAVQALPAGAAPNLNLNRVSDLQNTVRLLQRAGVL